MGIRFGVYLLHIRMFKSAILRKIFYFVDWSHNSDFVICDSIFKLLAPFFFADSYTSLRVSRCDDPLLYFDFSRKVTCATAKHLSYLNTIAAWSNPRGFLDHVKSYHNYNGRGLMTKAMSKQVNFYFLKRIFGKFKSRNKSYHYIYNICHNKKERHLHPQKS